MSLQELAAKSDQRIKQKKKNLEKPKDFDPLTSKKLLAEELDVNLSTLWRWENDGVIPKSIKIGGRTGWPRSVIRQWKAEKGWPEQSSQSGDAA